MSGCAKLVLSVSKKGLSSTLPSLVPCVSVKMGEKPRGGCVFVTMHLEPNCLGLASMMSNKAGADWAAEKQIDLSLG